MRGNPGWAQHLILETVGQPVEFRKMAATMAIGLGPRLSQDLVQQAR